MKKIMKDWVKLRRRIKSIRKGKIYEKESFDDIYNKIYM
jgi:hypothetical protein